MKPLRVMISAVLVVSCLLCLPKSDSTNALTLDVGPISFDGSFTITKSVDTNGDGAYDDSGKQVKVGDTLHYKIDWSFNNPNNDPLIDPYVYDTVPAGTHYLAGSATPLNDLSYSTDNGSSWTPGEPPDGSQAGTMLRWGPIPSGWVGANGSRYLGNYNTHPNDINASSNPGTSSGYATGVCLQYDSQNNPHICWSDNECGNGDIYYIRWDNKKSNWVCADGSLYVPMSNGRQNVSRNTGQSGYPRFVLDKNDNPCITWTDDSYAGFSCEVLFVRWNPSINDWVCADQSVYVPGSNGHENVSRNSNLSRAPMIKIDSKNNPHIAWDDGLNSFVENDIYYVKWDDTIKNWVGADNIIYIPNTNGSHNVTPSTVDSDLESFDLDTGDNPHLTWASYLGSPINLVSYVRYSQTMGWICANGSAYSPGNNAQYINTLNTRSLYSFVDTDANNMPHIVWTQSKSNNWGISGDEDIYYIKWDLGKNNWVCADGSVYNPLSPGSANISNTAGASIFPAIQLNSKGIPNIIWEDWTFGTGDVFFVMWDSNQSKWVDFNGNNYDGSINGNANVTKNNGQYKFPSISINSSDNPGIVWLDNRLPQTESFFVQKAPHKLSFNFSIKIDNQFKDLSLICNQAEFWHAFDKGSHAKSNSVCNTIDYNFTGQFELKKLVETTGDGKYDDSGKQVKVGDTLHYKIDWSFNNPNNDPLIDPYVYDTVPAGTHYLAGSATPLNDLSYSTDNGSSWTPGEPPDGSQAGTMLRWGPIPQGWTTADNIPFDPVADNALVSGTAAQVSLALGPNGRPCLAFSDYVGHDDFRYDIFFVKWDGARWVGVNGQPYDPLTGANAYTGGGFDAQYTNFANAVSMAMEDNFDEPFIGWYNQTPDLYTASLIKYLPPTAPRSFGFSAIVEETPVDSQINNQAFSRHALDQGVPALSNNVAVNTKKPVKKAILEVTKKAKAFQYNIDDIFAFQITVRNIGNLDATNVVVDDVFPRELKYVSSLPSGAAGPSKIRYQVGSLSPGQSKTYLLKFSLAKSLSFAGNCLTITNKASAVSDSAEAVTDYATISVCKQPPTKEIVLDATWKGINTKTNEARVNEEIKLDLSVEGGAPPYEITVNWGNGTKTTKTIQSKDNLASFENSYSSQGDFEVLITCIDSFGRSARQSRIIHIK